MQAFRKDAGTSRAGARGLALRASLGFALLAGLGGGAPPVAQARAPDDPRELLEQLNRISVDPNEVYVLRNARISRDRIRLYFNRGFLGLFSKVGGEVTGAVFSGDGEVLLMPPDPVERRNLARFTQSPILAERFTSAYLSFSDGTAQELLRAARRPDPEDLEQPAGFIEQWDPKVRSLAPGDAARTLQDLLGDRAFPYFRARLHGLMLGAFDIVHDERQPEAIVAGAVRSREDKIYSDIWCSMPSRASAARAAVLRGGAARVLSYRIDTRINEDHRLEGRAELQLESRSSLDRVLAFELARDLRVSKVTDERGEPVVTFESSSPAESETAARGNDWVGVVLPAPWPAGKKFQLNFAYEGSVIAEVGNGVLYVGAHGSWYPNWGVGERATYDLTFQYPSWLTLVATGSRISETSSLGWKQSRWVSDGPFPVAGFNFGEYESRQRRVGHSTIEVYATGEAETSLQSRYSGSPEPVAPLAPRPGPLLKRVPGMKAPLVPAALLDNVAEHAANAIRYFETLFGTFPYPRLAISQIPGNFAQGWPELVYLPTLSFLPPREQSQITQTGKRQELSTPALIAHEIAHQWWGNLIGWKTYHDQWLSEGFASYAAALFMAQQSDGEKHFARILRDYKRDLLAKTPSGDTVESGGPIWLGARLTNSLNPDGYPSIVYKKACWILHMLRMLMTDPKSGSDAQFLRMLRDFVAAYRGSHASTEDLVRHAEKYMTRPADLARNGRLDWFFSEWVYGTGIPSYKLRASVRRRAAKSFVIEGSIEQSGVPEDFQMLVPVVATYGGERKVRLGLVVVGEAPGRFRFTTAARPSQVAIDEDSILAVVR